MKLYRVGMSLELDLVVAAADPDAAIRAARDAWQEEVDHNCVASDASLDAPVEITSLKDVPHGWDPDCCPLADRGVRVGSIRHVLEGSNEN